MNWYLLCFCVERSSSSLLSLLLLEEKYAPRGMSSYTSLRFATPAFQDALKRCKEGSAHPTRTLPTLQHSPPRFVHFGRFVRKPTCPLLQVVQSHVQADADLERCCQSRSYPQPPVPSRFHDCPPHIPVPDLQVTTNPIFFASLHENGKLVFLVTSQ